MESEGSLPYSQQQVSFPYPEPHQSNPWSLLCVCKAYLDIIFSYTPIFFNRFLSFRIPSTRSSTYFSSPPHVPPAPSILSFLIWSPLLYLAKCTRYTASYRAISSTHLSLLPPTYHFFHPTYHFFHTSITSSTHITSSTPHITSSTHLSLLPPHLSLLPTSYHFFHPTYHFFNPPITSSIHLSFLPPTYHFFHPHITSSTKLSLLPPTYHFFHQTITIPTHISLLPPTYHFFHPPVTSSTHLWLLPPSYHFLSHDRHSKSLASYISRLQRCKNHQLYRYAVETVNIFSRLPQLQNNRPLWLNR